MVKFCFRNENLIFQDTFCLVDFLTLYLRRKPDVAIALVCSLSEAKKMKYHALCLLDNEIVAVRYKQRWKKDEDPVEPVARGREEVARVMQSEMINGTKQLFT